MKLGNQPSKTPHEKYGLAVILALFTLATTFIYIEMIPLGQPPDELAHISYVHEIADQGHWLPDYTNSRIVHTSQRNYLNHPPLYYTVTGLVGRTLHWNALKNYRRFRALSALMIAAGVFFWVLVAQAAGIRNGWICAIFAAMVSIPMFPYMAAAINNDDLDYLGVAVFFYGLTGIYRVPKRAWYVVAAGAAITFLTKATASLFLVSFTAAWLIIQIRNRKPLPGARHLLRAMILVVIICGVYYLPTMLTYGTPFPHAGVLRRGLSPPENPVSLPAFALHFTSTMFRYLPLVVSHKSFNPFPPILLKLFYVMLGLPIIAWLMARWRMPPSPRRRIIDACTVAFAVVVAVHFMVVYKAYLEHGVFSGVQPRYYNYLLPGIFLIGFIGKQRLHVRRYVQYTFACLAALFLAISTPLGLLAHQRAENAHSHSTSLWMPTPNNKVLITLPDTLTPATGHIDELANENGKIQIIGWAYDKTQRATPSDISVLYRNTLIGTVHTNVQRPDVAAALHENNANMSGFNITINGVKKKIKKCSITLLILERHGSNKTLKYDKCQSYSSKT